MTFLLLQSQNIQVSSMRNKSNRLEELFVKMVEKILLERISEL
jgi:ABC-2 type transport system ATP-binding protein